MYKWVSVVMKDFPDSNNVYISTHYAYQREREGERVRGVKNRFVNETVCTGEGSEIDRQRMYTR